MARTLLMGLAAAAVPIVSAAAAPASPAEAERLTALFERYVSRPAAGQPSGVTVVPAGDAYTVTLDLKKAAAGLEAFGMTLDPYTTKATLTPLPDGTWRVQSDDSPPLVAHFGQQTVTIAAATSVFDGVFDPKIRAFASNKQQQSNYTFVQSSPTLTQNRRVDTVTFAGTGAPAEGGAVAVAAHYQSTNTTADLLFKPPPAPSDAAPGNPAVPPPARPGTTVTYTVPTGTNDLAVDRLRAGSLLDLWAFVVAHPDHDSLVGAQDELKALLRAGLPFLDALRQKASLSSLAVTTPIGVVSAKTFGGSLDLSGLASTGKLAAVLAISDLSVPREQLPPWSAGLVPKGLDLHVGVDGFHAADAATEAVNDIDLKKDVVITPDQKTVVGQKFWPGGGSVTLAPSRLTTTVLDLRMEGKAVLGTQPAGSVTITGTGLDKEIAALQAQAGTDPGAGQVLGPLVLAKNLSKPNPDGSLTWLIEFGDGPVKINGAVLQ